MAKSREAIIQEVKDKLIFNPSKTMTFMPVPKKQMVKVEVTNTSAHYVILKWKNTGRTYLRTVPAFGKLAPGEKQVFQCIYKGQEKEKCKSNDRFSCVFLPASKNVVVEKIFKDKKSEQDGARGHRIKIIFQGVNDKLDETQQPTANDEVEDKDRQGQMRSKKTPADPKRPTVMMFMRKEGDSYSDEDDDDGTSPSGGQPVGDDMMTTRPAGNFTGQVESNEAGNAGGPKSEFRTTRPAGNFNGQVQSNDAGNAGAPKSDFRTTRPAGEYKNQVTENK